MQGLLAVFMNPPADEAGFNAWYDDEHVPLRMATPGFLSAQRFKAAEPDGPRYLAMYDLASLDVLQTPAYSRLNQERSAREAKVMASIPMIDRRELELEIDGQPWRDDPPYALVVCMSPPSGAEADFVRWYADEHIRMLLEVPGWCRVRLFRQTAGEGPAFMAVHELESPAVFDQPNYTKSISTEWRQRIRASVTRYERNLFRLHRAFQPKR